MSIEPTANPIDLFNAWFEEAQRSEPDNPNAMSVATVGPDGAPSIRMVLLKGVDDEGFVFYTNLESRKGTELLAHGQAALCFHWKSLRRQVRVEGPAALVADAEADAYFATRPRGSQIGAWASAQSRPMNGKAALLKEVAAVTAKYGISRVPRPPHWSGFRIVPEAIEFWRDGQFRLHDRLVYRRTDDGWATETLYP
jgi:pyridoxamine 5'-phosphate oxidase